VTLSGLRAGIRLTLLHAYDWLLASWCPLSVRPSAWLSVGL